MKKLINYFAILITSLSLISCSNNSNVNSDVDDETKKHAYILSNFDLNILDQAIRLETTILGTSMNTPLYEGELDLKSSINEQLVYLFKNSDVYEDNDIRKGLDHSLIDLEYIFSDGSNILIYRDYKPNNEPDSNKHSYILNNELLYKDFYSCFMCITTNNFEKSKYILDLKTSENQNKLTAIFDELYDYLNIEFM